MERGGPGAAGVAVGIDLGTVSATVAVFREGRCETLPNAEGSLTTPCVVSFTEDGRILVGEAARRRSLSHPQRTVLSAKRHLGSGRTVTVDGEVHTAEEICGHILAKVKRDAEARLGAPVTAAVLTVPAHFSELGRRATRQAARRAGLEVLRIVNEPTAAAFAYDHSRLWDREWDDTTLLVVHFGGGTFDVSLIAVGDGVVDVLATCGDNALGGDDWDAALAAHLAAGRGNSPAALTRLTEAAERAKTDLSSRSETEIDLPYLYPATATEGPLHLRETLTRAAFQAVTADLLARCEGPLRKVFSDAGIPTEVTRVVLVGGSARMPAVRDLVTRVVGPRARLHHLPGELVAHGAALQAAVLRGLYRTTLLSDVTPLSLGIGTKGGTVRRLIERNTDIPTRRTERFETVDPDTESLRIPVCQGESDLLADNVLLGHVTITHLGRAAFGKPIDVTFDLDASAELVIRVRHPVTGREHRFSF